MSKVLDLVKEKIAYQLKNGKIPWRKVYNSNGITEFTNLAYSHASGEPYCFMNQLFLPMPGYYWTFVQIKQEGLKLRKGSKANQVFGLAAIEKKDNKCDEDTVMEEEEGKKFFFRWQYFNVFHESCIEGLEPKEVIEEIPLEDKYLKAQKIVDDYLKRPGAPILSADERRIPCYIPSTHTVYIPKKERFENIDEYYCALFHEFVHSTKKALKRDSGHRKGDDRYSKEELVAEMGSSILCEKSRISPDIDNIASYCSGWLSVLNDNPDWVLWAATRAEAAAHYIITGKVKENK